MHKRLTALLCLACLMQASTSVSLAEPATAPIVLTGERGEHVVVAVQGPFVVRDAVPLARQISVLDRDLGQASVSAPPEQLAVARDFRDAAVYSLRNGLTMASNPASPGFSSSQRVDIQNLTTASSEALRRPWLHNEVITHISAVDAQARLQYVPDAQFRAADNSSLTWLDYVDGVRLHIQAYRFRNVATPARLVCETPVIVLDDPTSQQLHC